MYACFKKPATANRTPVNAAVLRDQLLSNAKEVASVETERLTIEL